MLKIFASGFKEGMATVLEFAIIGASLNIGWTAMGAFRNGANKFVDKVISDKKEEA